VLNKFDLLQEQSKARDDEAESHNRQAGTNPCQGSAFEGEIVTKLRWLVFRHWTTLCLIWVNEWLRRHDDDGG